MALAAGFACLKGGPARAQDGQKGAGPAVSSAVAVNSVSTGAASSVVSSGTAAGFSDVERRVEAVKEHMRRMNREAVPSLARDFEAEPDGGARAWLVRALSRLDKAQGMPVFENALKDPAPEVRAAAVVALGQAGGKKAIQALIDALPLEPEAGIRQTVAFWLGASKDPAVVDALGRALAQDKDANVRIQAARSLKWVNSDEAKARLMDAAKDGDERVRNIGREP